MLDKTLIWWAHFMYNTPNSCIFIHPKNVPTLLFMYHLFYLRTNYFLQVPTLFFMNISFGFCWDNSTTVSTCTLCLYTK